MPDEADNLPPQEGLDSEPERSPRPKAGGHRSAGRFARFAKLSSVTAGAAARELSSRMASAFQSAEAAEASSRKSRAKSAESVAKAMGELKGAAMKVGQMLSSDPDFLPPEMSDALATLQRDAPPMDFEMVRDVVEDALGGPLDRFFSSFSEEPIGAASIGQVHRATTLAGEPVAVKVQYPGIADSIDSDMKNLASLLNLARAKIPKDRVDAYLDEVTRVIELESDYLNEADNLERFQTVLRDVEGVRTPIPHYDLTRKNVLTMEFIEGQRLVEWFEGKSADERTLIGERVVRAYVTMMHKHGALHADPHPGNFLVDDNDHVVFLDLGCVRDYDLDFAENLARLMITVWRGDLDQMMALVRELNFIVDGVDPDLAYEWFELILAPLIEDERFDFGAWTIHEDARAFLQKNPGLLNFHPPREILFYLRVLAGLRGIFGAHDVRLNAYRLSKKAVKEWGLL